MLSAEQVKHIAQLARIELSEQEIEKYQKKIGRVLDYVNKLKEVETNGVETADGGTREMVNVWREDGRQDTRGKQQATKLIGMAPEVEEGQVKAGRVFSDKRQVTNDKRQEKYECKL